MGCGIYEIENSIDGKRYIGSSVNPEKRKYKHFWMLKRGIHDNIYLQNSVNKFGIESFKFNLIEECEENLLIERENHYINLYKSNIQDFGFNMALVNEFRRNNYNEDVKRKLSLFYLNKNGNFKSYSLTNINTNEQFVFETLVDGAKYLIDNGFAKGKPRNVRMCISNCLRGIKLDNGKNNNGSIRKTCYKHKFEIIN